MKNKRKKILFSILIILVIFLGIRLFKSINSSEGGSLDIKDVLDFESGAVDTSGEKPPLPPM